MSKWTQDVGFGYTGPLGTRIPRVGDAKKEKCTKCGSIWVVSKLRKDEPYVCPGCRTASKR